MKYCDNCANVSTIRCSKCETVSYCTLSCSQNGFKAHQLVCGGAEKRDRVTFENEPKTEFKLYTSIKKFIKLIAKEERDEFYHELASFIYTNICKKKLFDTLELAHKLRKNRITHWFFQKKPKSKKEIFDKLVGIAILFKEGKHDEIFIDRFCSISGRSTFLWLENHLPHINTWVLDSTLDAVIFWLKMGFQFSDSDNNEEQFLLNMYNKYGNDVLRVIEFQDQKKVPFFDQKQIIKQIVPLFDDKKEVFSMVFNRRELPRDQPTMSEYLQKDNMYITYSLFELFHILDLTHPKEKKIFYDEMRQVLVSMCQKRNLDYDLTQGDFYYEFRPRNRNEVLQNVSGFIIMDDNEIKTFCSHGRGASIIGEIQEKLEDDERLQLLSLPSALTFWVDMGFTLINASEKEMKYLKKTIRRHGYKVVSDWLDRKSEPDKQFKKLIMVYEEYDGNYLMEYNKFDEMVNEEEEEIY